MQSQPSGIRRNQRDDRKYNKQCIKNRIRAPQNNFLTQREELKARRRE